MNKKVVIYSLIVVLISLMVFLLNIYQEQLSDILYSNYYRIRFFLPVGLVVVSFITVRLLFPPVGKYRILFLATLSILFLSMSTSAGMYIYNGRVLYYYTWPRYNLIFIGMLGYTITCIALHILTKGKSTKTTKTVFLLADILALPVFSFLWIMSYANSPH